tara:strand:+ start:560 stop:1009 length:450 start_codon:yes stop_codon:yes gene_type:complete
MTSIDKKDIGNIEDLEKILKSKNLGSIKIQKGNYSIEVSSNRLKLNDAIPETESQKKQDSKTNKNEDIELQKENLITSPMVGVVYLSPDPSKPPYIKEGQHIKQGDTLMLIEAMKTFNEIKAPKSGVIKKIAVLNSQPVEFGEPLIIFE